MSVLSNFDIQLILQEENCPCKVCCKDELHMYPNNNKIIFNFDKSNEPGSHWAGLYISKDTAYYCDSFGRKPLKEVITYLLNRGIHKVWYNDEQIQCESSVDCGWFSCYFILMMDNQKTKSMKTYIKQFNIKHVKENDQLLISRFHKLLK